MTPEEEARFVQEAEARRRQKAEEWKRNHPAVVPEDDIAKRMAGLQAKFTQAPIVGEKGAAADPRIAQAEKMLDEAGIPPRHKRRIPTENHPWHEALNKLTNRLGSGFLIAASGTQGTGKTQLGSALIFAATDKLIPSRYALAMDFFIALKETFDAGSKRSESSVINEFVKPKLLVLDELDERSESKWENRLLFHMINQRYNNMSDTLLISRRSQTDFLASLDPSIQSRIQETGVSFHCGWKSFREERV